MPRSMTLRLAECGDFPGRKNENVFIKFLYLLFGFRLVTPLEEEEVLKFGPTRNCKPTNELSDLRYITLTPCFEGVTL